MLGSALEVIGVVVIDEEGASDVVADVVVSVGIKVNTP